MTPDPRLLTATCFAVALAACHKSGSSPTPPPTLPTQLSWARTYGTFETERVEAIALTSDGGFVAVGSTSQELSPSDPESWWFRVTASGDSVWQKAWGMGQINDVEPTTDGGFVMVSSNYVQKVSSDGTPAWRVAGGMLAVDQTSDDGFVVLAESRVVRLTSTGSVMWSTQFSFSQATDIEQTTDGGFVVVGKWFSDIDVWLMKLDSAGQVVWRQEYPAGGGGIRYLSRTLGQTADGGCVLALAEFPPGTAMLKGTSVILFDATGGTVWSGKYVGVAATAIVQTTDDGFALTGYMTSTSMRLDAFVLKIDSAGGVLWATAFVGPDDDSLASIQQTADGGYVVGGSTRSYPVVPGSRGDAWLLRLDPAGMVPGFGVDITAAVMAVTTASARPPVGARSGYQWSSVGPFPLSTRPLSCRTTQATSRQQTP